MRPVLTLAITSPSLPLIRCNDLVENRLAPKLSAGAVGVGLVAVAGGQRPGGAHPGQPHGAGRVGLSMEDGAHAIGNAANVNQAKGSFDGRARVPPPSMPTTSCAVGADYRRPDHRLQNGAPMRLKDVARSWTAPKTPPGRLGQPDASPPTAQRRGAGVILNIQRQPGANVIDTVDRIKALLPQLQRATCRLRLDVQVLTDRTVTIRASVTRHAASNCCWPLRWWWR
jgi:multidrug efflux pump